MTVMERFRRHRDHNNERPLDPPQPNIVRLVPPEARTGPELREPVLEDSILHDHETLEITRLGSLQAYRLAAAVMGDASFAASWSTYVKEQARWHRTLEALRWEYENR